MQDSTDQPESMQPGHAGSSSSSWPFRDPVRDGGAQIVHVDVSQPLKRLNVEPSFPAVLLVANWRGSIAGQVFLPAKPVIEPAEQWAAISETLAGRLWRLRLRESIAAALQLQPASHDRIAITVAICTRDRLPHLDRVLESLSGLEAAPLEVLVVDSAPTVEGARGITEKYGGRYVRETKAGLSRARNRALADARGELVAFTDDDCLVDAGWLGGLAEAFSDPLVSAVCGYIGPSELDTPAQQLFERHGGFERHAFRREFDLTKGSPSGLAANAGAGANMIVRRSDALALGGFSEDLGPGTPARSGDDKYFYYRVLDAGHRIIYDPARIVRHSHRADSEGLYRVMRDYGTSEFAYTTRIMLRHGDATPVRIWAWWGRHVTREAWRSLRGRSPMPIRVPMEEARGAVAGPAVMARSLFASRNRRIERASNERTGIHPTRADESDKRPAVSVRAESGPVSVALASRNRLSSLRKVLLALARQERLPDEVVVVLDGTTDSSAAMAKELDVPYDIRVIEQEHRGLAATRNAGRRVAAKPIVLFLDDDVIPVPGFVQAHGLAQATADEAIVLGPYPPAALTDSLWGKHLRIWWDDHFRRKGRTDHRFTYTDLLDGNCSMPARLLDDLGGFHEGFDGGRRQDWDLGVRALQRQVNLVYEPAAHGDHYFDSSFATAIRNSRDEGRQDVLLASRHPRLLAHLPLEYIGPPLVRGSRQAWARVRALRKPGAETALAALLGRLEAAGAHRRWKRVADSSLAGAYARGVIDALPTAGQRAEFFSPLQSGTAVETVKVSLDSPQGWAFPREGGGVELEFWLGDRPVARVPATRPASQWDSEDLLERTTDALDKAGSLARVLRDFEPSAEAKIT